ncbi:MAG: sigma factor, partial [Pseudomonadota bacterium]
MTIGPASARRAAERIARESYGRLLAFLGSRTGDLAEAEDALADAFHAALEQWSSGLPDNPDGWLLTVARRRLADRVRRRATASAAADALLHAAAMAEAEMNETSQQPGAVPDKRLALLFVCAHPAIDVAIRTPLMLQTVLG